MTREREHGHAAIDTRTDSKELSSTTLHLALDLTDMVAWEWDPVSGALKITGEVCEIFGLDGVPNAEQWFALPHPDDVARRNGMLNDVVKTGSARLEFRIVRPDTGAVAWVAESVSLMPEDARYARRLVAVTRDITPQKLIEEASRGQAALLDLTYDAVLVRDFESDVVSLWNLGAFELYGIPPHEAIGRVSHDLLHTIHPVPISEAKEVLARTGRWEGELIHTKRNGTQITVASRWALRKDSFGPVSILETNTDITERKRAEEELRHSEERYRTMVSTANEGIWLIDLDGKTAYANDRMSHLLGFTPQELRQRTVLDCVFPADRDLARQRIAHNLMGEAEQFDFRFRRKDGSELLVLACSSPARDSHGTIVGALGMFTDITERARAERERTDILVREQRARERAEEAQQRLSLLADASALLASSLDYEATLRNFAEVAVQRLADWCAVHLVDDDGAIRRVTVVHADPSKVAAAQELEQRLEYDIDASPTVVRVLHTGRPELLAEIPDELVESASSDPRVQEAIRMLGLKSCMVIPLASRGHILGAITLVTAESGRCYGAHDLALAEVLARRAALAVDNARLYRDARRVAAERSSILAQLADGVVIVDAGGRFTFVNEAARRMGAGRVRSSLEEVPGTEITTADGDPLAVGEYPLTRALTHRETIVDALWRVRANDGDEKVLQGSVAPVVGEDGELLGAVTTFRDVTNQVTLDRQKEEFLSAVAHDLKNPLTILKGRAQLLLRGIEREQAGHGQLVQGLAGIEASANKMVSLIDELLDVVRLQRGAELHLNRRATNLVDLVDQCVAEFAEAQPGQDISRESSAPELIGNWDPDRLRRVVANLVANAIKYGGTEPRIIVTTAREFVQDEAWAVLSVRDNGIGIPAQDLPNIFLRYHRGANVGEEILGTGIGLAGASQIVKQHGGTIDVESEEGIGSTFTVRLSMS